MPVKFSDLPSASALGGTETVPGIQGSSGTYGGSVKILISQIGAYVRGLFTTTPATIAEGGTGAATAAAARTNLDVPSNSEAILDTLVSAQGDIIYASAANTPARLAIGTAGFVLTVNGGATAPTWTIPVQAATQADQETGSITNAYVSPGRQQFHASAVKAWFKALGDGSIQASYNMTSSSKNSTGNYTPTWNVDFSSANYGIQITIGESQAGVATTLVAQIQNSSQAAGSAIIQITDVGVTTRDATAFYVAAHGDQ